MGSSRMGFAGVSLIARFRPFAGSVYRRVRREAQWFALRSALTRARAAEPLSYMVTAHATPLVRALQGVDLQLQHNKIVNLRIAAGCLDGIVLRPGQRLSFWQAVGVPSEQRGFLDGLALKRGKLDTGVAGGLCQMTNLLFWMALHMLLTVAERWRHSYDVFPDSGRTQPFGSGAACAWPALDLQIVNPTEEEEYRLSVGVGATHLYGAWTCSRPLKDRFVVEEREHRIVHAGLNTYVRYNELWQIQTNLESCRLSGSDMLPGQIR